MAQQDPPEREETPVAVPHRMDELLLQKIVLDAMGLRNRELGREIRERSHRQSVRRLNEEFGKFTDYIQNVPDTMHLYFLRCHILQGMPFLEDGGETGSPERSANERVPLPKSSCWLWLCAYMEKSGR